MNKSEIAEQIVEYVRRNHNSRSDKLMELIAAYDGERAIAESQAWISVEEKLPPEEAQVLFAVWRSEEDCDGVTHTWQDVLRGEIYKTPLQIIAVADDGDEYEPGLADANVTHWMPLPKPPKGN